MRSKNDHRWLSGSIAIVADAVNNLADASSSLITLVGFKLASMPEDKEHPYGHARIEYLAGMAVSIMIILVGAELGKSSFDKILNPEPVDFSWVAVAVLVLAIIINDMAGLVQYFRRKKDRFPYADRHGNRQPQRCDLHRSGPLAGFWPATFLTCILTAISDFLWHCLSCGPEYAL